MNGLTDNVKYEREETRRYVSESIACTVSHGKQCSDVSSYYGKTYIEDTLNQGVEESIIWM
jgi:hypothetical protein